MYLLSKRVELVNDIINRMKKLDAEIILWHGMPMPAPLHNNFQSTSFMSAYTALLNFMNFPAGVIPITRVRDEEQTYDGKGYDDSITKNF